MESMRTTKYVCLIILVSVLIVYTYAMRYREIEQSSPPDLGSVPEEVAGYVGTDEYLEPTSLRILGSDASFFRTYTRHDAAPIWVFIGYFGMQQEYSQIHSPKNCYPGAGWNITYEGSIEIGLPRGAFGAKKLLITDGRERRMVVYWFSTPTGTLMDEFALKWYQAKRSMLGRAQVSTFIRFSTIVPDGTPDSEVESALRHFIQSLAPLIESVLIGQPLKGSENAISNGPPKG
jgi:EpsI family protein